LLTLCLSPVLQIFNFDVRQLDWNSYLFDYLMGVKRYVEVVFGSCQCAVVVDFYTHVCKVLFVNSTLTLCRNRSKRYQWFGWSAGFIFTYIWSNYSLRQPVRLKNLEEYKQGTAVITH
uniref:Sterile domain-containing protein n=1 Tax=Gongylonema pulchrum TaxID=637853 RepID=A0A183ESB2_9BILA